MAAENGLELGTDILLEDAGDLPLRESEGDHEIIRDAIDVAFADGCTPILLGGDHSVSFPAVEAAAAALGPVDILHFDAHPDLYDDFEGNPFSHASPFARIMERGLARRLVQVGIRTLNRHCRAQADRFGVEVIEMRHFSASPPRLSPPKARRSSSPPSSRSLRYARASPFRPRSTPGRSMRTLSSSSPARFATARRRRSQWGSRRRSAFSPWTASAKLFRPSRSATPRRSCAAAG
jgi:hypothetical protein